MLPEARIQIVLFPKRSSTAAAWQANLSVAPGCKRLVGQHWCLYRTSAVCHQRQDFRYKYPDFAMYWDSSSIDVELRYTLYRLFQAQEMLRRAERLRRLQTKTAGQRLHDEQVPS
jgi:hypothetical protein